MKRVFVITLLASLLLVGRSFAHKKDTGEFPLTAHIVSVSFTHIPLVGRATDNAGNTVRMRAATNLRTTTMRIGNILYSSNQICSAAHAGMDVPARLEDEKGFGKVWSGSEQKLTLLIGSKACTLKVTGSDEVQ